MAANEATSRPTALVTGASAGIGEQFQEYFRRGLAVIGFERTAEAGVYLIGKWESS